MGNSVITGMRFLQFGFSHQCLKSSNGQPTEHWEVLLWGAYLQVMSRQTLQTINRGKEWKRQKEKANKSSSLRKITRETARSPEVQ